jgi:hypothetical protein
MVFTYSTRRLPIFGDHAPPEGLSGRERMPRPFRNTITGRSAVGELIRADKDRFIRQLYALLGPEEFWQRRLVGLARNGKRTSYDWLMAYLQRKRIEIPDPP